MIYGFLNFPAYINNVHGVTSIIGELNRIGYSFSKDNMRYNRSNSYLDIFESTPLPNNIISRLTTFYGIAANRLNNLFEYASTDSTVLLNVTSVLLLNANGAISNIIISPDTYIVNGTEYPSWVRFTINILDGGTTHSAEFKVWLNNDDFLLQYPLGEIKLIYPINDLVKIYTDFNSTRLENSRNNDMQSLLNRSKVVTDGVITGYDSFTVTIKNPSNSSDSYEMDILVVYNGNRVYCNRANYLNTFLHDLTVAGDGTVPNNDWTHVVTTLAAVMRFYIVPLWDNVSIENTQGLPVYSPSITPCALPIRKYFKSQSIGYSDTQLNTMVQYSLSVYNSLGFICGPDLDNTVNYLKTWSQLVPDYFLVSVTDMNINKMSIHTQKIRNAVETLLSIADNWVPSYPLLNNVVTQSIDGNMYVCLVIDGLKLMVLTKRSYLANM
jgi:hypothetical protein